MVSFEEHNRLLLPGARHRSSIWPAMQTCRIADVHLPFPCRSKSKKTGKNNTPPFKMRYPTDMGEVRKNPDAAYKTKVVDDCYIQLPFSSYVQTL